MGGSLGTDKQLNWAKFQVSFLVASVLWDRAIESGWISGSAQPNRSVTGTGRTKNRFSRKDCCQ